MSDTKTVPVEPTDEMRDAALTADWESDSDHGASFAEIYKAMIAAAPQAPVSGVDPIKTLESAIDMLKLAPEDCLGCVQDSCTTGWWIRDELIDNLCQVRNAIEAAQTTQPPTAVSGFDAVGKPVADLIDEAAKQTIRAERLEAENDRLRKELGRAHDLAETMNGNCGEQFDRAELAEAKLAELKAWKQDWQETIDCVPFCEFGEELEQIISNSSSATAQTTPHPTAELLALPGKWREEADNGDSNGWRETWPSDAYKDCADQLQAALDKLPESGWLDIKDAPKDGTEVELVRLRGFVKAAKWDAKHGHDIGPRRVETLLTEHRLKTDE